MLIKIMESCVGLSNIAILPSKVQKLQLLDTKSSQLLSNEMAISTLMLLGEEKNSKRALSNEIIIIMDCCSDCAYSDWLADFCLALSDRQSVMHS